MNLSEVLIGDRNVFRVLSEGKTIYDTKTGHFLKVIDGRTCIKVREELGWERVSRFTLDNFDIFGGEYCEVLEKDKSVFFRRVWVEVV